MNGAHLIRNGTDAADPGRNVGRLQVRAAAEKRFEESWRLKDFQLHIGHLTVLDSDPHPSFAFDAGEIVNLDCFVRHDRFSWRSLSARNEGASELKFLKVRTMSSCVEPSRTNQPASDSVFGFSFGPKQP